MSAADPQADDSQVATRRAAERAARESYGRLLAFVAARSGSIAAAEDALSDAFARALAVWPERGVPDSPEAWLLTTARRTMLHGYRHARVAAAAEPTLDLLARELLARTGEPTDDPEGAVIPDDRLKLLFVCAHPAIDPAVQTPLMLQTVLGLDAARIAAAFLVPSATMGQRLVRAKGKIRDAGIPFVLPEAEDLPQRLDAVLAAIYGAYGTGWDDVAGLDPRRKGLAEEAIWLGRVLLGLLPEQPEVRGLLALMLFCQSRVAARRTGEGAFVPLDEQDTSLWDAAMVDEAGDLLAQASRAGQLGRYQLEAAIQSVHAARALTGQTHWPTLAMLHEGLTHLAPTIGVFVSRAVVIARAGDPRRGLELLDEIPPERVAAYQPYWVARATLLAMVGKPEESLAAYQAALGLTEEPAVRSYLMRRAAEVGPSAG